MKAFAVFVLSAAATFFVVTAYASYAEELANSYLTSIEEDCGNQHTPETNGYWECASVTANAAAQNTLASFDQHMILWGELYGGTPESYCTLIEFTPCDWGSNLGWVILNESVIAVILANAAVWYAEQML